MFFCSHRNHGCSRYFPTRYGLKVHLRSCTNSPKLDAGPIPFLATNRSPNHLVEEPTLSLSSYRVHDKVLSAPYADPDVAIQETWSMDDVTSIGKVREARTDAVSEEGQAVAILKLKMGRIGRATSQKEANDIIDIISMPSFQKSSFLMSCTNYNDCRLQE